MTAVPQNGTNTCEKLPETLPCSSPNGTSQNDSYELLAALRDWPLSPQKLCQERFERILLALYDAVLCLVPLLLIVKIGLCVVAYNQDSDHTGIYGVEGVGQLTRNLISLNSQVRSPALGALLR